MADNKKQYIALTIGPIYRTLTAVKSTKAIWAASYLFSHLMHTVLAAIKDQQSLNILMPYTDAFEVGGGTINLLSEKFTKDFGLFPDRLIAESLDINTDFQLLEEAIKTAQSNLVSYLFTDLKNKTKDAEQALVSFRDTLSKSEIDLFINDYFQLSLLKLELGAPEISANTNPIFKINSLLDTVELQQHFPTAVPIDYLKYFLEDIFYNQLVQRGSSVNRFPSTIEITTSGLSKIEGMETVYSDAAKLLESKDKADSQEGFLKELLVKDFDLLQHHKYIAIVIADGDNMGKLISAIYTFDPSLFEQFSKQLLHFAYEGGLLVKASGAYPVYAGGDDLLFFSPLDGLQLDAKEGQQGATIFHLLEKIDELFETCITNHPDFQKVFDWMEKASNKKGETFQKPSMSYGMSISYYKHPLNESLSKAYDLLFQTAKKTSTKDAISFALQKHSGQLFGATIHKETKAYKGFIALQSKPVQSGDLFFTSITHRLDEHEATLFYIYDQVEEEALQLEHLDHFFDNNFDEDIHNTNRDQLNEIKQLIHHFFTDATYRKAGDNRLKQLYGLIRFVQFLKTAYKND